MSGALDTIFAQASGVGRSAVAVLRISGPDAAGVLARMTGRALPPDRRAVRRHLYDGDGGILDDAIVCWMPGPRSYTGEDVVELHLHGGRAVVAAIGEALLGAGLRPAEAGEFTRRAFLAGRMDLLEAEAIADLIDAETEAQRRQALRQAAGALGARIEGWSGRIRTALAHQEALIDFPDESLPPFVEARLREDLLALHGEMQAALSESEAADRLRRGLVFAIAGAPNVGKSSLLNALARRDVAIVSTSPGTTRDVLEVPLDLRGIPVTLIDTAGLRETDDPVEAEGVRRARARAESADLVLGVVAPEGPVAPEGAGLLVANKIDLWPAPPGALGVSAVTGEGMAALEARLAEEAERLTVTGAAPVFSRARHRAAVEAAAGALGVAVAQVFPELRAEELRQALLALSRVTGAVDAEQVLDEIFAAFCIGK